MKDWPGHEDHHFERSLVEQKSLSAVRERESSLSEMSPSSNQPELSNSASSTLSLSLSPSLSLCWEPSRVRDLAYRGFLGVWLEMPGILFLCRAYKRVGFWRGLEMFIFSGGFGCNYMRCLVDVVFSPREISQTFWIEIYFYKIWFLHENYILLR